MALRMKIVMTIAIMMKAVAIAVDRKPCRRTKMGIYLRVCSVSICYHSVDCEDQMFCLLGGGHDGVDISECVKLGNGVGESSDEADSNCADHSPRYRTFRIITFLSDMHRSIQTIVHETRCREANDEAHTIWPARIVDKCCPHELRRFLRRGAH